jgi:hypothetical protein
MLRCRLVTTYGSVRRLATRTSLKSVQAICASQTKENALLMGTTFNARIHGTRLLSYKATSPTLSRMGASMRLDEEDDMPAPATQVKLSGKPFLVFYSFCFRGWISFETQHMTHRLRAPEQLSERIAAVPAMLRRGTMKARSTSLTLSVEKLFCTCVIPVDGFLQGAENDVHAV